MVWHFYASFFCLGNKDLVLKTCLVLGDFNDIKFKVDNFTKENMSKIEQNWTEVSRALKVSIELITKYGYNRKSLSASNALIPIAYFIYKNNLSDKIIHSQSQEQNRKNIIEWLSRVILRGTFGGTPDSIYPVMRNLINQYPNRFPLPEIIEYYRGKRKSISFSEDDEFVIKRSNISFANSAGIVKSSTKLFRI